MQDKQQWRVAVVGAGPAGLYAAEGLAKRGAAVDVFDRLFAPFGLVRYGVAPDHQKIKKTIRVFQRILDRPEVRFFGNVRVGSDISVQELLARYDQVLVSMGSSCPRELPIEGIDLEGSISATDLVAWYNGHPDYVDWRPRLDDRVAVIVGMGNVAVDVARVLLQDPAVLASTDISDAAKNALAGSAVEEVFLLGRRGPDQAAFDIKEVRDLLELPGVRVSHDGWRGPVETPKGQFVLDLPKADLTTPGRKIVLRFCAAPCEVRGDGRVEFVRLEQTELIESAGGVRAQRTGRYELMEAGLLIRAVGYHGEALPGVPFHPETGTIPNDEGQVIDEGEAVPGLFVAGWIKRGPTGLIGSNKACALETVAAMERAQSQRRASIPSLDIAALLADRGVQVVDGQLWNRIDALELHLGRQHGRARLKFTSLSEALTALQHPSEHSI